MLKIVKKSIILFIAASLLLVPLSSVALAEDSILEEDLKAGKMAVDFIVVRPVGFVSTVIGSVCFVLSLPFSAIGGNAGAALTKLVQEPAVFTFQRPLGVF
jgi:hypothetical protein